MPALPNVNRVLKAVVSFTSVGVPCVNVFHIMYAGQTPNNANASLIAQNVHGYWSQNFIPYLVSSTILNKVDVFDLTAALGATGEHVANIPGAGSGTALPNNVALVGSWKINNRYRGGKPRTYLTGFAQANMQDANTWTATTVGIMLQSFEGFNLNVNSMSTPNGVGPFTLGCVHYYLNKVQLTTPTFDPFVAVTVQSGIRSQRGRLTA